MWEAIWSLQATNSRTLNNATNPLPFYNNQARVFARETNPTETCLLVFACFIFLLCIPVSSVTLLNSLFVQVSSSFFSNNNNNKLWVVNLDESIPEFGAINR